MTFSELFDDIQTLTNEFFFPTWGKTRYAALRTIDPGGPVRLLALVLVSRRAERVLSSVFLSDLLTPISREIEAKGPPEKLVLTVVLSECKPDYSEVGLFLNRWSPAIFLFDKDWRKLPGLFKDWWEGESGLRNQLGLAFETLKGVGLDESGYKNRKRHPGIAARLSFFLKEEHFINETLRDTRLTMRPLPAMTGQSLWFLRELLSGALLWSARFISSEAYSAVAPPEASTFWERVVPSWLLARRIAFMSTRCLPALHRNNEVCALLLLSLVEAVASTQVYRLAGDPLYVYDSALTEDPRQRSILLTKLGTDLEPSGWFHLDFRQHFYSLMGSSPGEGPLFLRGTQPVERRLRADSDIQILYWLMSFLAAEIDRVPPYASSSELRRASRRLASSYYKLVTECGPFLYSGIVDHDTLFYNMGNLIREAYTFTGRTECLSYPDWFRRQCRGIVSRWRTKCSEAALRVTPGTPPDLPSDFLKGKVLFDACVDEDYSVRTRKKWLETLGLPDGARPACGSSEDTQAQVKERLRCLIAGSVLEGPLDISRLLWAEGATEYDPLDMAVRAALALCPRSGFDRVFGLERMGTLFASVLSILSGCPMSVVTFFPAFDVSPHPSRLDRLLIVDDNVTVGYSMLQALKGLTDLRSRAGPRWPLGWMPVKLSGRKTRMLAFSRQLVPLEPMPGLRAEMEELCRVRRLTRNLFSFELRSVSDMAEDTPSYITDQGSEIDLSAVPRVSDMLRQKFEKLPCTPGGDPSPEWFRKEREELIGQVLSKCTVGVSLPPLLEEAPPLSIRWALRKGLTALISEEGRKCKPSLLFNYPNLVLRIGRYFFFAARRDGILADLDALVANSTEAVPFAVALLLAARHYDPTRRRPIALVVAKDGGHHISGILPLLARSLKGDSPCLKLATLTALTAFGRFEEQLDLTLRAAEQLAALVATGQGRQVKEGEKVIEIEKVAVLSLFTQHVNGKRPPHMRTLIHLVR